MTGITAVLAALVLLLVLFALGVPVLVAFLLCDIIGIAVITGSKGFGLFANSLYETATTGALVTIPLFLLVGELLLRGRAIDVLFRSVDTLIGRVTGRQYVLTIVLATIFGALSGTAMGVAAMLGRSLLPGISARGYDTRLASGAILAGASLAPIIPPSVLVIIVGTLAGVSISGLLVAGLLPGLLLATLFLGYIFIRVAMNPELAPAPSTQTATRPGIVMALLSLLPFSLIIVMIMGFILLGIATPSEAAATGVIGAALTAAIYGNFSLAMLWQSLRSAMLTASMILVIMASSKMFSQLLALTGGTGELTRAVVGLDLGPLLMLVMMMALPFLLCMFIDQIALMLVIIPIYKPLLAQLGFDPIWFWLLFLINITIGGITPPFGYTIFALKGAADHVPIADLYRASWPFVGLFLLGLAVLALFPGIVTFLPNQL